MIVCKKVAFLTIALLFCKTGIAQTVSFPGAQGWAAYTTGGHGGKIIRVTNLNSSGDGSFAQAIAELGPRIIVFGVAGVIDMQGTDLYIENPFVTIAGQTAPSPGITIIDAPIYIKTNDVIIQHLKIRPGAVDENCSASGPRFKGDTPDEWRQNTSHTITMSNNIIAEALSNSTHPKGEHSKGTLIHDNVTEVAILNNLYASNYSNLENWVLFD